MDLVFPIWKPINWTSFDVVKKIRSILKIKKIGHAGTLDPFAEGILVICTGKKTTEVETIMNQKKEYKGVIKLGCRTPTLDPESKINEYKSIKKINEKELFIVKNDFIGKVKQIPPQFSAIKHKGVPMYKYARKNIRIDLKPREVNIYDFEIVNFNEDSIEFIISCGRGTYIRSIARDFALKIDTLGYLTKLQRTRIGDFNIDNVIKIENFEEWLYTNH
ncbi:MAG: tRNA pseudouridine(55) synthase TruB [Candidatus Marinimicrobia bacterium]|nr:tRNA pseudouridine(55) synthase TruB [Candidatus Neomarinimicrobiota bacterium]|tara:strand:+ start:109 stop:765 length:657 start_codon:yes stop_codon:yes gene_type:complete